MLFLLIFDENLRDFIPHFLIEDDDLLKKYNAIWDKANADIKKEFDSKPVYNKNFLKTKIKSYDDKVTDFYKGGP